MKAEKATLRGLVVTNRGTFKGTYMNIVFIGHSRSGKDTACEVVASVTGQLNAGTVSRYLTRHVAAHLGVSCEQAYAERHANREHWRAIGDEIRQGDPALFAREMFAVGPVGGGIRARVEFDAARREGLFHLAVWIARDVPVDPTLELTSADCDLVIENSGTLPEFREKVRRFAILLQQASLARGLAERVAAQSELLSRRAERVVG